MSENRVYVSVFGKHESSWLHWLEFAEGISSEVNLPINYLGISKATQRPTKARKYARASLVKAMGSGDLKAAELFSVDAEFKQLVFDWRLCIDRNDEKGFGFVGGDADNLSWDHLIEITEALLGEHLRPLYGFGGVLHRWRSPIFHAFGGGTPYYNEEECQELEKWGEELRGARRFEQGFFRDVYRLNVLSRAHLDRDLQGGTVEQSIQTGQLPGRMIDVNGHSAIWLLHEDEIRPARALLSEGALLL